MADSNLDGRLVALLEKQKQELVVRALKKHEEARAERVFADKIIASISDLFFVLDENRSIVKANEGFQKALGLSEGESHGLRLEDLVAPGMAAEIMRLLANGELRNMEVELATRSGDQLRVSLNGSTLADSGRLLHMMIATDKSDIYRMMARMRDAQEQLIHSGRLASLGEMAAGIGHELTQPLNAILLFSRNSLRFLDDPIGNKARLEENLSLIIDRVTKAAAIIKSLKGFARKSGEPLSPVDVNAILTEVLVFFESQISLLDIEVRMQLADGLPPVLAQDIKLEQVFLNLIQNAIQAMGDVDAPKLIISTSLADAVEAKSLAEQQYVTISIRDTGKGVSEEIAAKIFDPFFTTREVGTGMGLGLSIASRIVQELSGFIRMESGAGAGACFTVYLPPGNMSEAARVDLP